MGSLWVTKDRSRFSFRFSMDKCITRLKGFAEYCNALPSPQVDRLEPISISSVTWIKMSSSLINTFTSFVSYHGTSITYHEDIVNCTIKGQATYF